MRKEQWKGSLKAAARSHFALDVIQNLPLSVGTTDIVSLVMKFLAGGRYKMAQVLRSLCSSVLFLPSFPERQGVLERQKEQQHKLKGAAGEYW